MKNKLILSACIFTLLFGILAASRVSAQTTQNPMTSLVQKIAQKFGLKQQDVQAVFDEERTERQTQMKKQLEDRLTQAVKDGKINETQKQAILKKQQEIQNDKPDPDQFKNMTAEQRRQEMDKKRTDMETFAKQEGLTLQTLQELLGGHGKGFRPGFGKGMRDAR